MSLQLLFALLLALPVLQTLQTRGAAPTEQPAILDTPDAYAIYSVLILEVVPSFAGKTLIIQRETDCWANLGVKGSAKFDSEWGSVLADYAREQQTPKLLQREFTFKNPYELVAKLEVQTILKRDGWKGFHKKFHSGAFVSVSSVGFNPEKTKALVFVSQSCGSLCGNGRPYFLQKQDGKWTETRVDAEFTAWFSE